MSQLNHKAHFPLPFGFELSQLTQELKTKGQRKMSLVIQLGHWDTSKSKGKGELSCDSTDWDTGTAQNQRGKENELLSQLGQVKVKEPRGVWSMDILFKFHPV